MAIDLAVFAKGFDNRYGPHLDALKVDKHRIPRQANIWYMEQATILGRRILGTTIFAFSWLWITL